MKFTSSVIYDVVTTSIIDFNSFLTILVGNEVIINFANLQKAPGTIYGYYFLG